MIMFLYLVDVVIIATLFKLVTTQDIMSTETIDDTQISIVMHTGELVNLGVKNITKYTAQLEWKLSPETSDTIKALRVNCTTVRSLVEPYEINPPIILLHNPSVLGSKITLQNLSPAIEYSCNLIGAVSLDVGAEKLAILSKPILFSTLLERPMTSFKFSYGQSTLKIILGGGIPTIVIMLACILMIVGYCKYRKSKRSKKDARQNKYRMHLPKDLPYPGDSPVPSPPPPPPPPQPPRKGRSKRDNNDSRKERKSSRRDSKQRRNTTEQPSPAKKSSTSTSKSKRPPKKQSKLHNPNDTYAYNVLPSSSSEDEYQNRYNETRPCEFGKELGWDPLLLYHPKPLKSPHGLPDPIQPKHVGKNDLSSPMLTQHWEEQAFSPQGPPTYTDEKYYQHLREQTSYYY